MHWPGKPSIKGIGDVQEQAAYQQVANHQQFRGREGKKAYIKGWETGCRPESVHTKKRQGTRV